jgi:type VI secretion system protein ImpA
MSDAVELLVEPLSAETPCGVDLEDTQLLAGFDAFRLFGSVGPLPHDTPWREIRDRSLEALAKSRDLRLLAHLAAAAVRLEGLERFCTVVTVADRWLTDRWEGVYPRVDEDALFRKNALNCLADRMAIVDAVRRAPLVSHKQLGVVTLRDLDLATGQVPPTETDTNVASSAQIEAALAGTPVEELSRIVGQLVAARRALSNIVSTMQSRGGFESAPDFDALSKPLARMDKLLADHLAARAGIAPATPADTTVPEEGTSTAGAGADRGEIRSRQDAIRAIDAVALYFRRNEPSSPVPLLLDRAKRLVSKTFIEVLEDIVPDSVAHAKLVGGIRADEGN